MLYASSGRHMSIFDTLNKLLGDPNEKELKKLRPVIQKVRQAEKMPEIQALTLETLPKKTDELRARAQSGTSLDDLLPEAFATAIRACELIKGRTITMGKQE